MAETTITVDTRAVERMLDRIGSKARARRELSFAAGRAADQGAALISGVPRDTGDLARSIKGRGTWIVATATNPKGVRYGRFVLRDQPANVPGTAIARILADEIKQVIFG